jgi:type VI secretion system protein ImpK
VTPAAEPTAAAGRDDHPDAGAAGPRTLRELADPLAWLVLALRGGDRPRDAATLRARADAGLADFAARALGLGHRADAVEDARFALAAVIDETLAEIDEEEGTPAAALIDRRLAAADDFFERIERLRDADDRAPEALEVFHLCLTLGYRGRYRFEGAGKLRYLAASIAQDLARMHGDRAIFAGGAVLPDAPPPPPPRALPVARAAIIATVACVALWAVYRFIVDRRADAVIEAARRILPQ